MENANNQPELSNPTSPISLPFKLNIPAAVKEKRTVIMVIVIVFILSATVVRQSFFEALRIYESTDSQKEKLLKLTEKADYLKSLDSNQLDLEIKKLEQVFPSKKPSLELLYSLKSLALENQVSLGSLELKPGEIKSKAVSSGMEERSEEPGKMESFSVEFFIVGDSNNISDFIKNLQRTAPLMKIDNLKISIREIKEDKMVLQINFDVSTYYQSPPEAIPSLDSPIAYLTQEETETLDSLTNFKFYPLKPFTGTLSGSGKENFFSR